MNRKELMLVIVVSLTSSLATFGLVMALWGERTVFAKDILTPQKEVRAQKFVLVDKDGNTRADLGTTVDQVGLTLIGKGGVPHAVFTLGGDGTPSLILANNIGLPRASLTISPSGEPNIILTGNKGQGSADLYISDDGMPSLAFFDTDGKARVLLETSTHGDSILAFNDKTGNSQTVLKTYSKDTDEASSLAFFDKNVTIRTVIGFSTNIGPVFQLTDENQKASISMGMPDGSPIFDLYDKNQKPRASLALKADGEPSLSLSDENRPRAVLGNTELETPRTGTVEKRAASSLVLFDKDGKVLWSAP
jgi:hypothetical protein